MISSFYSSVFPPIGLRVLATFKGGLKSPPTHTFYDSDADLIEAANTYNSLGKNVYHGCAVYSTSDNRKGSNVQAVKSLWVDLDVGEKKPYATQKDAAQHFEQFRTTLGLPKTHVVSSGNGVHEYLPFSKPILPEQWDRLAAMFAACMDHFGVKHDTSRTQDKASILRIPGTENHKSSPAKAVTLKRLGEEAPASDLWKKLKAYADTHGLIVGEALPKGKPVATNNLVGTQEFPPSEGAGVAKHCPVLEEVAATGGDVPYDIWWRAMGVAKHTTEPEATAAEWTRNREATGHEKADYVSVLDAWTTGPTTCNEFSKHSSKCASCPNRMQIKSPISLGVVVAPYEAPPEPEVAPGEKWEFKAQWIIDKVKAATHTEFANGLMLRRSVAPDGSHKYVPFCDRYWQVMRRIRSPEGVWQLEIGYEQYPGRPFKTFTIDSSAITSADVLKKEFSARELHIYGGTKAMEKAQDIARYEQHLQFTLEQETATVPTMGWATVDGHPRSELSGEFVMGDTVFRPKQEPKTVLLSDTVDDSLRGIFTPKGTKGEWVSLIDHIYNRPGAEAYQFVIAAMFASPLVRLMPNGGTWHGIPIVLRGDSGAAKSSTALAALSMYCKGDYLMFNAAAGEGGQGDTINALSIKIGGLRNLPCIMDELTNASPERISSIMYMFGNGRSRDRMNQGGKMVPNPYRWDMVSLITSNDSLHEILQGLRSRNAQEAGQLRSFEVEMKVSDLKTVFKGISRSTIDQDLLSEQYGVVGRNWIQFVVDNRERIADMLASERRVYMIDPDDMSGTRFYKDLLITVKVAASLAARKGYIKWDVDHMIQWAESQLLVLRDNVKTKDWEGQISDFVASLHGRTIVTRDMKLGPGRRSSNVEMPLEPLSTSAVPVARKALTAKRFIVTANALKDWAQKQRILPKTLLAEMVARGYFLGVAGDKVTTHMINIGSGTTVARPQAPCYEFDYDKVAYDSDEDTVDMTNVVALTAPVLAAAPASGTEEVAGTP